MNDIVCAALLTASQVSKSLLHDQWEFVFCLSGGGEYALGGHRLAFAKGDMVAVPPRTRPRLRMETSTKYLPAPIPLSTQAKMMKMTTTVAEEAMGAEKMPSVVRAR